MTSIVDMKVNKEQPYVIMDGGINHLNYYGQAMAMKQPYCTQLDTEGNEKTGEKKNPGIFAVPSVRSAMWS